MRYNPATNTGMIVVMNQFREDLAEIEPLLQLISDLIGVGEKGEDDQRGSVSRETLPAQL
jgi:hypothetical protein